MRDKALRKAWFDDGSAWQEHEGAVRREERTFVVDADEIKTPDYIGG